MDLAMNFIELDGSHGEGGGQILRSALSLSLCTGQPFRLLNVRKNRDKPGLRPQHLTAVRAAALLANAMVTGDVLGSSELTFRPQLFGRDVAAGTYHFDVGTASSAPLVLQTVLPALLGTPGVSTVIIRGGTYNPKAPPFDFIDRAFAPLLQRLGADVRVRMDRPGFYPSGGGQLTAEITGCPRLARLDLCERGPVQSRRATVVSARLPAHVAERELFALQKHLGWPPDCFTTRVIERNVSAGNVVLLEIVSQNVTELFSCVGERRLAAEQVAGRATNEALAYLEAAVPVGEHLADQLLLPLALGQGGVFCTSEPSLHTRTQVDVIQRFLPAVKITLSEESAHRSLVQVTVPE